MTRLKPKYKWRHIRILLEKTLNVHFNHFNDSHVLTVKSVCSGSVWIFIEHVGVRVLLLYVNAFHHCFRLKSFSAHCAFVSTSCATRGPCCVGDGVGAGIGNEGTVSPWLMYSNSSPLDDFNIRKNVNLISVHSFTHTWASQIYRLLQHVALKTDQ